jgi:predicted MPP superfamily phosphohydrolase
MGGGAISGSAGLRARRAGALFGALAAIGAAYGWFEAGWVRLRELDVELPGLPPELDGVRIAHLSDLHLGPPSRGVAAVERAVAWVEERQPDLTLVTGDLLTRPSGEPLLRKLVARLPHCYAILGNHDFAISRDPAARRSHLRELAPATLLSDEGVHTEIRGRRVYIAGSDPRSRFVRTRPSSADLAVARDDADLRILLCHYPRQVDTLPADAFDLIVAGHMHDGQIALPYPGGKLRLAHLNAPYNRGVYRLPGGLLHVSPGLGTTFVPFRFAARPEATELRLRSAPR